MRFCCLVKVNLFCIQLGGPEFELLDSVWIKPGRWQEETEKCVNINKAMLNIAALLHKSHPLVKRANLLVG